MTITIMITQQQQQQQMIDCVDNQNVTRFSSVQIETMLSKRD